MYIPSPSANATSTPSPYLHVDTSNPAPEWSFFSSPYSDLAYSSSYTSKIRQRHISVGSYYDNKTTTVTLHPTHPLYLLGSAPVSPRNRPGTLTANEFHYTRRHHSPISTGAATYNALRRVNPFFDNNVYASNDEHRRSSSLHRDAFRSTPIKPVETPIANVRELDVDFRDRSSSHWFLSRSFQRSLSMFYHRQHFKARHSLHLMKPLEYGHASMKRFHRHVRSKQKRRWLVRKRVEDVHMIHHRYLLLAVPRSNRRPPKKIERQHRIRTCSSFEERSVGCSLSTQSRTVNRARSTKRSPITILPMWAKTRSLRHRAWKLPRRTRNNSRQWKLCNVSINHRPILLLRPAPESRRNRRRSNLENRWRISMKRRPVVILPSRINYLLDLIQRTIAGKSRWNSNRPTTSSPVRKWTIRWTTSKMMILKMRNWDDKRPFRVRRAARRILLFTRQTIHPDKRKHRKKRKHFNAYVTRSERSFPLSLFFFF